MLIDVGGSHPRAPFMRVIDEVAIGGMATRGDLVLTAKDWHYFEPYLEKHKAHKVSSNGYVPAYLYWGTYRRKALGVDEMTTTMSLRQSGWMMQSLGLAAKGPGEVLDLALKGISAIPNLFEGIEKGKDLIDKGIDLFNDMREKKFKCATPGERRKGQLHFKRGDVKKKIIEDLTAPLLHAINLKDRFFLALTCRTGTVMYGEKGKRLLCELPKSFVLGDILAYLA